MICRDLQFIPMITLTWQIHKGTQFWDPTKTWVDTTNRRSNGTGRPSNPSGVILLFRSKYGHQLGYISQIHRNKQTNASWVQLPKDRLGVPILVVGNPAVLFLFHQICVGTKKQGRYRRSCARAARTAYDFLSKRMIVEAMPVRALYSDTDHLQRDGHMWPSSPSMPQFLRKAVLSQSFLDC